MEEYDFSAYESKPNGCGFFMVAMIVITIISGAVFLAVL